MRVVLPFLLLAFAAQAYGQATTLYSIGSPTDEEQLYLEFMNRARANPAAEGLILATTTDPNVTSAYSQFGVNLTTMQNEFNALAVRPPLAMNARLLQAARGHSQDMFTNAFQGHDSTNGDDLGDRAAAAGYGFSTLGENVFSFSDSVFHGHAGFEVDWGPGPGGMQPGRGHRANIHGNFREVGVGMVLGTNTVGATTVGPQLVTQDFGTQPGSLAFVTGVAFYDLNSNNFYDAGEGIGGVTVNVNGSSFHAITANSGGYAVPVPTTNANRAVTFSGLGFNTNANAVISGGNNVKVDLSPVYVAPTPAGPSPASTVGPTSYSFNSVIGATGYEWRHLAVVPAATDGANNLSLVTAATTGSYSAISTTVKHAGAGSYHLADAPGGSSQSITYNASFHVQTGASLSFRSRLGLATTDQVAKVQVSTNNGLDWTDVFSQTGSGGSGEGSFALHSNVSLAAFAGKDVRLRLLFLSTGVFFLDADDDGEGWYVDEVSFTNVLSTAGGVVTALAGNGTTSFDFTAPAVGNYILSVRPLISGRALSYGPPLTVPATNAPPSNIDITVQQPAGTNLTDGVSPIGFGSVLLGASQVRAFTVVNSGIDPLTSLAVTVDGAHAADFVASALGATTLPATNDSTTFTVTFTPAAGGARTAVLHVTSNDPNESPFDITLTGSGDATPQITDEPDPLMRKVGTQAQFTVVAASTPAPTFQWRKNTVNIAGATTNQFTLAAVKLTDAGAYDVVVKNGAFSRTSATAQLGVVEDLPKTVILATGGTATMTCNATGNGLGMLWRKNGGALPADAHITGGNTKTLTLKPLIATDSATYTCEVTNAGGTVAGATTHLRVVDAPPDIDPEPIVFPAGIVSGTYDFPVPFNVAFNLTPTSFTATGLPPGLKIDPLTGRITGKPTATKIGGYLVKVTASNAKGKDEATGTINVADFPTNVAGIYNGPVARHAVLNLGLGGRLDLTISATGGFSGTLTLGAVKHILTGALDVSTNPLSNPTGTIVIKRTGTPLPPNLTLAFTIDRANNRLLPGATVTNGTHTVGLGAWRQIWNATTTQATPYLGYYTFGLRLPAASPLIGDDGIPQGWSYGSFTVGKDGKLTLAGKTADGEGITGAAVLGPQGEILVHLVLYTTAVKGSLLGVIKIDVGDTTPANLADTTDNTVDGDLDQTRPPNPAATHRLYKPGFGVTGAPGGGVPVALEAVGARYQQPAAPALILGLVGPGVDNAELEFQFGGIANTNDNPNVTFDVGALNKLTLPTALAENPAATKLTVTPATGVMSGSFTLDDPNPRTVPPVTPATVKRSVTFTGMIFKDGANAIGGGYYHLDELPGNGPPPTTPTTTRKLSGKVTAKQP